MLVTQPGASQPVPVAVATVGVGSAIRGTVAATVTASVGGKIVRLDITTVAPVEVNSDAPPARL